MIRAIEADDLVRLVARVLREQLEEAASSGRVVDVDATARAVVAEITATRH